MITQNNNPYYDDFDETKGFHQILFKPGYAVQARELTQLQSILQQQIERFGKHIFKEGSLVLGGQFSIETNVDYVYITESLSKEDLLKYKGTIVTGTTSGVVAHVYDVAYKDDWSLTNNVLMIRYKASGDTDNTFIASEILSNNVYSDVTVASSSHIGKGSIFSIEDGVVFSRGYFVAFAKQQIVVDPISTNPSCKIGFDSTPVIVTSVEDDTLLDNAQGSYNYAAPGADRLKLIPYLKRVSLESAVSLPEFISLFTIEEGKLVDINERPEYAVIYDEIAKRTSDTNGDFIVRGLNVLVREHLDTGSNGGYITLANGGDSTLLDVGVEPGLAYVKGYEVNNTTTFHLSTPKSTEYETINSEIISVRNGNYIIVNEMVGDIEQDKLVSVNFYNIAETRYTQSELVSKAPDGVIIGTAKVKSLVRHSSNSYRLYLFDIVMNSGYNIADIRAVGRTGFFADSVLVSGNTILQETNVGNSLVFPVGASYIKSLKNESSISDTTFTFRKTFTSNAVSSNGTFSVTNSVLSETHNYGSAGVLGTDEKNTIIVTATSNAIISLPGTVTVTSGSKTVTGSSTYFTRLNVNDRVTIAGVTGTYVIETITNNTSMTLKTNVAASVSGAAITKQIYIGDIIDFSGKGSLAGESRSITVTSDSILSFDMKENVTGLTVNASFNITRNAAIEIKKIKKAHRFVKINCSTLSSLVNPITLGFSDVFKIHQIRIKSGSDFIDSSEGTDVTDSFSFDTGQRDDFYDHATIKPRSIISLTANDYLLVELDYFAPDFSQGVGFFSIDSYNIDDEQISDTTIFTHEMPTYKSISTGTIYNLRDCIDFRPVKQNTSTDSITVGGASSNPATTNNFYIDVNGVRLPNLSSQVICDYSYYLARRDVVVISSNGTIYIVKGVPGVFPITPIVPSDVMGIYNLYIPPYPSLSTTYARILDSNQGVQLSKISNERYTMRDIGALKNRIIQLEYYNALTLLEKSATDMSITDEFGLDRFKNGFFVDGFMDHSLGDTFNPDYNIAVDSIEQTIRPVFDMESFRLRYDNSSLTTKTGNLISLPYTESVLISQPRATTIRNIEQSVFRYIGQIKMNPSSDVWVDTKQVDKTVSYGSNIKTGVTTNWGSWETYFTGYNVYRQSGPWTGHQLISGSLNSTSQHVGYFTNYADAYNATYKQQSYSKWESAYGTYHNGALVTTTEQERTGIQTVTSVQKESQNIGNFVTDVSVIAYIRPQRIKIIVTGLKANTQYNLFFDGEKSNGYVTPLIIPANGPDYATESQSLGAVWKSNAYGELAGYFYIPAGRFRTGEKEVKITDSPTNANDATSYAEAVFTSSGLSVQKQNTVVSTAYPTSTSYIVEQKRSLQQVQIMGPSCMAYSFLVSVPNDVPGVYLTSVDVYIQAKDASLGCWFEIREMSTDGGITRNQVPYSEVWYKSSEITVTSDATTPHKVTFPAPVYLLNNTQYAFVIHTEGLNPNYYFWVSRLGETDVKTNTQVTGRQLTGNVFTTNNNLNWDIVPDIDLTVNFNRAKFNTGTYTATFDNESYEFANVSNLTNDFTLMGETIIGSSILTVNQTSGLDTIIVGDKIIVGTKTANVLAISGSSYYTDYLDLDAAFDTNVAITVKTSGDVVKDVVATVTLVQNGEGQLSSYDNNLYNMIISNSNGLFFIDCLIEGVTSGITGKVDSLSDYKYSTINSKPNHMAPENTSISFSYKGIKTIDSAFTDYAVITEDSSNNFPDELKIMSYSVQNKSATLQCTMSSTSEYVSPVVDTSRINIIAVHNIINDDVTDEENASGGNLINKYISQSVTLADEQDAEDLHVYLSAYVPSTSTVKVWVKLKNNEDGTIFENMPWIELESMSSGEVSSSVNTNDFTEMLYRIPDSMLTGLNGAVQYENNGNIYTGFKYFSVKVGLLGTNSAIVPRVGDLRVIALQR